MILATQMLTIFLCICFVSGVSYPNSMTITRLLPSEDATEGRNSLVKPTARSHDSTLVEPTPFIGSASFERLIQSTTSTPSLQSFSKTATSFKTMSLETSSTRTEKTTFPHRSSFLRPVSSLDDNTGRKPSSQVSSSGINDSDLEMVCPKRCLCRPCKDEEVEKNMVELKCKTKNLRRLLMKEFSISKNRVCSLNLAQNNISSLQKNVFRGFEKLRSLILDDNKLQSLRQKTFRGLSSLQYLSVRNSNLRTWKAILHLDLPRIKVLNLQGNKNFSFLTSFLKNTTLSSILGLSFSNLCKSCNMSRQNASWNLILPKNKCYYVPRQYYPIAEELLSRYIVFEGKCEKDRKCKVSLLTGPNTMRYLYRNKCWEVVKMLRPLVLVLGSIAIVFNTFVVMVIVATKPLRSFTALLLISHMSFCDLLIGVYAVAVGDGHSVVAGSAYDFRQWRRNSCPYFRSIFVFGQVMEVATSLLVTTERYFAIVFCMNPSIRVSKKHSAIFLLLFWIIASIFSYLLQVHDGSTITDNFMCIIVRNLSNHDNTKMFYSQGMMLMLVIIYVVNMLQYCHIYIYARRSTINTGIRRETKLAFRICIMVFSSFVFFAFPNIIMIIMTVGSIRFPVTPVQNMLLKAWLPPMFLVFNACLNPILFAYRNEKFVNSFKDAIKKLKRFRLASFHVGSRAVQSRRHNLVEENSGVQSNSITLAGPRPIPSNSQTNKDAPENSNVKKGAHNLAFMKTKL